MKIAQILYDKAHYIWDEDCTELPVFPPCPGGEIPLLIDITNIDDVQEGYAYDKETGLFCPSEETPQQIIEQPTEIQLLAQQITDLELLILGGVI